MISSFSHSLMQGDRGDSGMHWLFWGKNYVLENVLGKSPFQQWNVSGISSGIWFCDRKFDKRFFIPKAGIFQFFHIGFFEFTLAAIGNTGMCLDLVFFVYKYSANMVKSHRYWIWLFFYEKILQDKWFFRPPRCY